MMSTSEIEAAEAAVVALGGESIRRFILAGNATFTLENPETGRRFTFKVRAKEARDGDGTIYFVSVLTGADNVADYTFLGTIFTDMVFRHGRRSAITPTALSAKVWNWFWNRVTANPIAPDLGPAHVHHEGRCGRCGRKLTVPESIQSGLGPECAGRV